MSSKLEGLIEELLELSNNPAAGQRLVLDVKQAFAQKHNLPKIPSNPELLTECSPEQRGKLIPLLRRKPTRTLSGVSVIAAMTAPFFCPHGVCTYCPGGPKNNSAQSYTGFEPAAMSAKQNNFDPLKQVNYRLNQFHAIGHETSKCELIVMGGTFTSTPEEYQDFFIKGLFDALNQEPSVSLAEAISRNETAAHRCIGLTIETRPDWCKERHVDRMLSFGATRVELGVQHPDDNVYKLIHRGHSVQDVRDATRILRDSCFKVGYHVMPGLPGSNPTKDIEMMRGIFTKTEFKPDMLKVYPTLVVPGTALWHQWKRNEFTPYNEETAVETIAKFMADCPRFVRIMRMQRDIPAYKIDAGVTKGHLADMVEWRLKEQGLSCGCIRCREIGHKVLREKFAPDYASVELNRLDYEAANGREVFLSFDEEKHDALIGFLSLRLPSIEAHRQEVGSDGKTALVRELHVYGQMMPFGEKSGKWPQHSGYGKALLGEAERIAKIEFGCDEIAVISGVGVRGYYKKLGYERVGPYMGKAL